MSSLEHISTYASPCFTNHVHQADTAMNGWVCVMGIWWTSSDLNGVVHPNSTDLSVV